MAEQRLTLRFTLLSAISIWTQLASTSGQTTDKNGTPTFVVTSPVDRNVTQLSIPLDYSNYSTDLTFLSVAIDTDTLDHPWRLSHFINSSHGTRMVNVGRGLSPCILRIGGSAADFLVFDNGVDEPPPLLNISEKSGARQFYMEAATWDALTTFTREISWDIMFNLNIFMWKDKERKIWDPTNARDFLNYSSRTGVNIPHFQLGNEVSSYDFRHGFEVTPEELVEHFKSLRSLLGEFPRYNNSGMVGPDLSSITTQFSAKRFLTNFLDADGGDVLYALGQHQYYMSGYTATVRDFYNHTIMADMKELIDLLHTIVWSKYPGMPLWLSETSSAFGGGVPEVSNRYVAGFLWLDKLGISALNGIAKVFRQTFFSSSYALVDYDYFPFPDYFLSVLFKRLVLGPVFNVTLDPMNPDLRVYAHCARTDFYNYPRGAVVVYYLNLENSTKTLENSEFSHLDLDLFQLTAPDSDLTSKYVLLNNKKLELINDDLPPLEPVKHKGPVQLGPLSFGFIVIPAAKVPLCGYTETTGTTPTGIPITTPDQWEPNRANSVLGHGVVITWGLLIGLTVFFISK